MLVTRPYLNQESLLDPNTLLLLHFDGSNNSTSFVDSSQYNRAISVVGGSRISTTQSMFGGASGEFSENGNIQLGDSPDLEFSGDFTIEYFVYFRSAVNGDNIIASAVPSWQVGATAISVNGNPARMVFGNNQVRQILIDGNNIPINQWIHHAWVRRGTTLRFYRAGTLSAISTAWSQPVLLNGVNHGVKIGGNNWDGAPSTMNGFLDELHISNTSRDIVGSPYTFPVPVSSYTP
jgi:hypothetical protein